MKHIRFKIKDLGLKKRLVSLLFLYLITYSLLFTLQSLISLIPIVYADDMGLTQRQNMPVTAFVGPQPRDYQFNLEADDNPTTIYNGKYYDFTITYGAKASAKIDTANTVIVFDWSQALTPNNENMLVYVYGSADDAYGGAKPVIDPGNKRITWTIPNMPPGTIDQKVGFRLFANSYDKTTIAFPLTLTATMVNQYVTMQNQTLTEYYQYQAPPPGPTATPGPQSTTSPTPTPTSAPPAYSIDISDITNNTATIRTTTAQPTKLTINYGTSPGNLTQSVSNNTFQTENALTLSNLKPDTQYYFTLTFIYENGQIIITEIYTLHTAKQALSALALSGTAVISFHGTILLSESLITPMTPGFALLTSSFPYDVTVSLPQSVNIKSLEAIAQQQLPINTLEMNQQQPGIYNAHMPTLSPGMYSLFIKTLTQAGTLTEQKIADLRIIAPLSVSDQQSGTPLENARIFLFYFDQGSNSYKSFSAGMFDVQSNPGYTDTNGIYAVNLPPGRYQAEVSALWYDRATVDFTLGKNNGENFPHILLKKDPTNLTALLTVTKDYLMDSLTSAFIALQIIATSSRVFHVVATTTTASLVLLSYLLFLLKSHTSLKNLPLLFFFFIDVAVQKDKDKYLFGKVTDAQGTPLSLVRVEVENANSKTILRHTTTNKTGKFYFLNKFTDPVNLIFVKEGFHPISRTLPTNGFSENGLQIMLEKGMPHHPSPLVLLGGGFRDILGMLFETALVLSIILEILFFFFYGFAKTAPFLILSVINILLWLFFIHEYSQKSST